VKIRKNLHIQQALCRTASEYYIEERYPFNVSSELTKAELETILKQAKIFMSKLSGDMQK